MNDRLSIQLWSVRDDLKADMPGTLAKLKAIGFGAVEFAGFADRSAKDIKQLLDDNGLVCSGSHTPFNSLSKESFEQTVAFHKEIGCQLLVVPWLDPSLRNSESACEQTMGKFMEILERIRPAGLRTGFHVHGDDVRPLESGKSPWQIFAAAAPDDFILQDDTSNSTAGGADLFWTLRHHPKNVVSLHVKEYPTDGTPLGQGDVPLNDVVAAARKAGTEWLVVEHESYQKHSPMVCAELAYKALSAAVAETA